MLLNRPCLLSTLAATLFGSLVGCEGGTPTSPPSVDASAADPTPPAGLQIQGTDLIQWDTVTPEFSLPIAGTSATVAGVLTSPQGRRRVELRESGRVVVLAESGWNLPAAGALAPSGERVVCWNVMLGPERSGARPPHPTRGVALRCRSVGPGGVSPVLDATERGMLATWMRGVSLRDGQLWVRYLRDRTGWLVVLDARDRGSYERTITVTPTGLTAGEVAPAAVE